MTRRAPVAAALVTVLMLVGCGDEDDSSRLDPSFNASSSTAEALGDEDAARKRAEELVFQYVSSRDTALGDPAAYRNGEAMKATAEGSALGDVVRAADDLYREKKRQAGTTTVVSRKVTKVDLSPEPSGSATDAPAPNPLVVVEACLDASEVRVVTTSGASAKGERAGGRDLVRFGVINRSWPVLSEWRVAWLEDLKKSC